MSLSWWLVSSDMPGGDKLVWLCLCAGTRSLSVGAADAFRSGESHSVSELAPDCPSTAQLQARLPIVLHCFWHQSTFLAGADDYLAGQPRCRSWGEGCASLPMRNLSPLNGAS